MKIWLIPIVVEINTYTVISFQQFSDSNNNHFEDLVLIIFKENFLKTIRLIDGPYYN